MKPAKRLKKDLISLTKIEEIIEYTLAGTPECRIYKGYITDIRDKLETTSIDNKEHDIRLAKRIIAGRVIKDMTLRDRIKYGIRFIIYGAE